MSKHYKFKYKKPDELLEVARELKLDLPFSTNIDILLKPSTVAGIEIPNRLVTQPMEGFDGSAQGAPGELTYRRYRRFASGGSGMIWFEATSIDPDGRSNPHQLMLTPDTLDDFTRLVIETRLAATEKFGAAHRPLLVIQLTHSGRYADPNLNHHKVFAPNPFLDPIDSRPEIWKDEELEVIGEKFQKAI
ncbi:MAG: hypothetical protein J7L89_09125, partial [Bacteroidales bacterium]|nr:hypothetical protein [Bacteroidales bacterium]